MKFFHNKGLQLATLGLFTGLTMGAVQGCDEATQNLLEQCGLACPGDGILEGNASISGIANVDAFFQAVVTVQDVAASIEGSIKADLLQIAAILELSVDANASVSDIAAAVSAELDAQISANVQGSLTLNFQPPKCQASLEVTAEATARCDASVDPGSVEVKCEGSCAIDASAQAECSASGSLSCEGTAPNLACEGTCTGSCSLEVAATCEGQCNGTCMGTCSAQNADGSCAGSCDGMCQGTCELSGGGSCSGSCQGSCEYTPPSGSCEGGAQAKCTASAEASVECSGGCEGNVEPPMVSAECEASVKAEAQANVECTPPSIDLQFQFAAGVDAQARAEFNAKLKAVVKAYANIVANAEGRISFLSEAVANLGVAATGAVRGSFDAILAADADLFVTVKLGCALDELANVGTALGSAQGSITGSLTAFASVSGSLGSPSMRRMDEVYALAWQEIPNNRVNRITVAETE
jgi:hypothetical protein